MVIYFSKINLFSTDIFNVYKEKKQYLDQIKNTVYYYFDSGLVYSNTESYIGTDGELHVTDTSYELVECYKYPDHIEGVIYKKANVWYKERNQETKILESKTRPTIEDVKFYYDVQKELIGFHTRNRFGHREFNNAFSELINQCMIQYELPYRFQADLYNEGLNIHEIEDALKKISNIKKLCFSYKAPNPYDDSMLENLSNGLDNTIEKMEEANAHGMSVIFDSYGNVGLNINSSEIKKNIAMIGNIHSTISDREAIRNGYASVKAVDRRGKVYTTEERKPIKREIYSEDEFYVACKETIINIFIE